MPVCGYATTGGARRASQATSATLGGVDSSRCFWEVRCSSMGANDCSDSTTIAVNVSVVEVNTRLSLRFLFTTKSVWFSPSMGWWCEQQSWAMTPTIWQSHTSVVCVHSTWWCTWCWSQTRSDSDDNTVALRYIATSTNAKICRRSSLILL